MVPGTVLSGFVAADAPGDSLLHTPIPGLLAPTSASLTPLWERGETEAPREKRFRMLQDY